MNYNLSPRVVSYIEGVIRDARERQRTNGDFPGSSIIYAFCCDPKRDPRESASFVKQKFHISMFVNRAITILVKADLTPAERRDETLKKASDYADKIISLLQGETGAAEKAADLERTLTNSALNRIILISVFSKVPALNNGSCLEPMLGLNRSFASDCLVAVLGYIQSESAEDSASDDEVTLLHKEIRRLESELARKNTLLVQLQDDFDERTEEMRKEQAEEIIIQLNSERYGCILDLIASLNVGLKKIGRNIPLDISSLPTLVRQLLRFVADAGIEPICDIGTELTIGVEDLEKYSYRGTPFADDNDTKKVVVITTGWRNRETQTIISLPVVQEKE